MKIGKLEERLDDTFDTPLGGTLTLVDYFKVTDQRQYKYLVKCSICSKDKELFPDLFEVSYSKLKLGQIPCGCSKSKVYSERQLLVLIDRKNKTLNHTFLGFVGEFTTARATKIKYLCPHRTNTNTTWNYLNCTEHGCKECASEAVSNTTLSKHTYPDNVVQTKSKHIKGMNRRDHKYQCQVCSSDRYVTGGYCSGWFKFVPHRLSQGYLSCRCGDKYIGDDSTRLGRLHFLQEDGLLPKDIVYDKVADSIVYGFYQGVSFQQDYSSATELHPPKIYHRSSWYKFIGREDKEDHLYSLRFTDPCTGETFIKIGRAFDVQQRVDTFEYWYDIEIMYVLQDTHENIIKVEQHLHKQLRQYSHVPLYSFGGKSECYNTNVLNNCLYLDYFSDNTYYKFCISQI